jgi:hypothetical protein
MDIKKSQAAIEYLVVSAILMAIIIPLTYYYFSSATDASEDVMQQKCQLIGNQIVNEVKELYLSPGFAKKTLRVQIPTFVKRIYSEEDKIVFDLTTSNGNSTFIFPIETPIILNVDPSEISSGKIVIIKNPSLGSHIIVGSNSFQMPDVNETGNCFDGFDNDWDGMIDACDVDCINSEATIFDDDLDNFSIQCTNVNYRDCNDTNFFVNPSATEVCGLHDDDCDGSIDEGIDGDVCLWKCVTQNSWDWNVGRGGQQICCGDDQGAPNNEPPSGFYEAVEFSALDGYDNDCDGFVDEIGLFCSNTNDACVGTSVMMFQNVTDGSYNAHAQQPGLSFPDLYNWSVCCDVPVGTLDIQYNETGNCNQATLVSIDNSTKITGIITNAHVDNHTTGLFTTDICLSTDVGQIDCMTGYGVACNPALNYTCLFKFQNSTVGLSNAHVADCGSDYNNSVCCRWMP